MSDRKLAMTPTNWLAWAKINRHPEDHYFWHHPRQCALGQFTEEHGLPLVDGFVFGDIFQRAFCPVPHTFGAATERLEKLLAEGAQQKGYF